MNIRTCGGRECSEEPEQQQLPRISKPRNGSTQSAATACRIRSAYRGMTIESTEKTPVEAGSAAKSRSGQNDSEKTATKKAKQTTRAKEEATENWAHRRREPRDACSTSTLFVKLLCSKLQPVATVSMTIIFSRKEPCHSVLIVERGSRCIYSEHADLKQFVTAWLEETTGHGDGAANAQGGAGAQLVKNQMQRSLDSLAGKVKFNRRHPSLACDPARDNVQLVDGVAWMSEAALWVRWRTKGDFLAKKNFSALSLSAEAFHSVMQENHELLAAATVYAWAFIANAQDVDQPTQCDSSWSAAWSVSDYIDEQERKRLYNIVECPPPAHRFAE